MARATLEGGSKVSLEGITLAAPGIEGEVVVERGAGAGGTKGPRRGGRREADAGAGADAGATTPELDQALRRQGMRTNRTIVVHGVRREPPQGRGQRGRPEPLEPLTLTTRRPRQGRAQVVLVVDHGIATWHQSQESQAEQVKPSGRRGTKRGDAAGSDVDAATLTYKIPQAAPAPSRVTRAGFLPIAPIIKVITFPVSHVVGEVARFGARRWDRENHPPKLRTWNADGTFTELAAGDWDRLAEGRVLLFVHGTFSSTEGGFGALPVATRQELHKRYGGRVLAYDHPTIADDPSVNAREFFGAVGDHALDLDIVCHSRGGLVSRSIAERPGELAGRGPKTSVKQIVLVACVNNGTILADADHWGELVDRYTTLLNLLPLPGAVTTLATVLAVVKSIAVGTVHDLKGLSCMAPGSDFLLALNVAVQQPPDATYRAITSNYEPTNRDLKAWLHDEVRDRLFDSTPNDMLVAITSMIGANGSNRFPIDQANVRSFEPADAIEHSMYFGQPRTSEAFKDWLTGH